MTSDRHILDHIEALVAEEHRLWSESAEERLDEGGERRLRQVRRELDGCWDALRRRRANPDGPEHVTPAPDPPNELDGPDPEPPHLEHGVHGDGPAPDPDVPRSIP
jgi:hypothetical protein